jgi:Cu(I)/Ag(I) efflux system protein CusF
MRNTKHLLAASTVALATLLSAAAFAQPAAGQPPMDMAGSPSLTDGEVRKIDKETGKITIKHGEIKHLDMPGMTMVFLAKDKVQAGDKVRFMVAYVSGKMTVTEIQSAN